MYLLHLHDEGQKHLKYSRRQLNVSYSKRYVLNAVFTLTINGHNDKVKQLGIFLLSPPPMHPPHPTPLFLQPPC